MKEIIAHNDFASGEAHLILKIDGVEKEKVLIKSEAQITELVQDWHARYQLEGDVKVWELRAQGDVLREWNDKGFGL